MTVDASEVAPAVRDLRWEDFSDITAYYFQFYEERDQGLPMGITLFHERPSLEAEVEWFSRLYKDVISGRSGYVTWPTRTPTSTGRSSVLTPVRPVGPRRPWPRRYRESAQRWP